MLRLTILMVLAAYASCDCTIPVCEEAGQLVPVIDNCDDYQVCLEDLTASDAVLSCAGNQTFSNGSCKDTVDSSRCTPSCIPLTCGDPTCGEDFERKPISGDCSSYILCVPDSPTTLECPEDKPYFDAEINDCSESSANCCNDDFLYCEDAYTQIADPANCRQYYLCLAVGIPTEADLYACEEGEKFDGDRCVVDNDGDCSGGNGPDPTIKPQTTIKPSSVAPIEEV